MKKIVVLFIALLASVSLFAENPDFAYPKTTLEKAIKSYNAAIKSPDNSGVELIKSLLQISGATAAIDPDSVVRVIPRIDRAIDACKNDADKALILTIKAELINSIYSDNRWKYDKVNTPDDPLPADITEWNGRQFCSVITSIIDKAFRLASEAPMADITSYAQVIKSDKLANQFFPTVASFVALKAINLGNLNDDNGKTNSFIAKKMMELSRQYSNAYFYWADQACILTADNINAERKRIFDENSNHEAAGYILTRCLDSYSKNNAPDWAVPTLEDFIKRFPTFWDINSLKNTLNRFTQPSVSVICPQIVAPGVNFEIKLEHEYTLNAGYKIFKISAESFKNNKFTKANATMIKSFSAITDPSVAKADSIISTIINQQGYYAIQPIANGEASQYSVFFFRCLPYIPSIIKQTVTNSISLADYVTGAPVTGTNIKEITKNKTIDLGNTDSNGAITFTPTFQSDSQYRWNNRTSYDITYQGYTFNFFNTNTGRSLSVSDDIVHINLFTDRQLYHPGDTIKWAAISYSTNRDYSDEILDDQQVYVQFLNANDQLSDSMTVTTDSYGRAYGYFIAPSDGLTGNCQLEARLANGTRYFYGSKTVEVSDFKLPTFYVKDAEFERDIPIKGEVTLSSQALTYSGMPVTGAKVEAEIWEATRWRWFAPSRRLGNLSAETDKDGEFSIVVPDSITSKNDGNCFIAKITVTSADGEARQTSVSFTTGKPYFIIFNPENNRVNYDDIIKEPFKAYNASGKEVSIDVRWWLTPKDSNDAVASGVCSTDNNASIDLSEIPAGEWSLSVAPVDSTLANKVIDAASIVTYSIKNNSVPPTMAIFVPETSVKTDAVGNFSVTFGVPDDDTYVYQSFASAYKSVSFKTEAYKKGFHTINLTLPKGKTTGSLILFTVRNGKETSVKIEITLDDKKDLKLEGSTMRDRLTPGSPERWTLKLSDLNGNPQQGAMIATMFNSSLNALAPYNMPKGFNILRQNTVQNLTSAIRQWASAASISKDIKGMSEAYLRMPDFNPAIGISQLRSYKFMARSTGVVNTILVTEDEGYVMDNAGMIGSIDVTESVAEPKLSAAGAYKDADEEVNENLGDTPTRNDDNFEYRDSEVLQAFWMPNLYINKKGETTISFIAPNANTTWSFNAFAWNNDLRSATMIKDLIASKPVMVQPNLPRFLRVGDSAKVLATVYNNSDSASTVSSVIELFDAQTGITTSTSKSDNLIAAGGSAIISINVDATADVSMIGYRVRSTLGKFTDGEQALIPVEPATSAVIESEAFYLNPGEENYEMTIPKGRKMQSTLDFTANPAWNVIKELPGLAVYEAKTSTGAANRLFGAATAAGLVKSYPSIADVLKNWSENPDAGAMTSRLSQNDQLKAAVLSETPWVQAAASDSHRMARLNLLLDKKETERSINSSIATLRKLQRPDGGWAWGEWCDRSSPWSTNIVLQQLGRLKSIGYLPKDKGLEEMVARAIAYYETTFDKNQKTDRAYTYIISLFPDSKISVRGTEIINATRQQMINNWKSASAWDKAMDAIILNSTGYSAVAKEIISSLSEFAVTSKDRGTSFPSVTNINDYADLLYAFARIEPSSKLIDGMRQWLTLYQQTTTDFSSVDPTRIIAAFTACGSNWLASAESGANITINGEQLDIDNAEFTTGHIVTLLPSSAAGREMSVTRLNAAGPAYGAVISRFTAASTEVKAVSCPDISIEKRVTAFRNGKWQYVDHVNLGEQVRILLTIKATRNLEYVTVTDQRPASFEPVDQLPGWTWSAGAGFYRENRDSATNLFISYLPKGTYQITIDMTASIAGSFTSGIATVQSQLTPSITAHSAGSTLICK